MSERQRATLAGAINRAEEESVDERGKRRTLLGSRTSLLDLFLSGNVFSECCEIGCVVVVYVCGL